MGTIGKLENAGYCIHCGERIPLAGSWKDRRLFFCNDCYRLWSLHCNMSAPERMCHVCGKASTEADPRSASIPVCKECWEKVVEEWHKN